MYSEVVNRLGLSQNTLEMMVVVGLGIFIFGVILVLYWKHIIIGCLALGAVVVLASHKDEVKEPVSVPVVEKKPEVVIQKKEEVINEVKPSEPVKPRVDLSEPARPHVDLTEKRDIRGEFMERCINLADYTKTQCDELWDDRVREERELLEDTKFKGKKHGHYRKV